MHSQHHNYDLKSGTSASGIIDINQMYLIIFPSQVLYQEFHPKYRVKEKENLFSGLKITPNPT
jgi:hypothetical protein